MVNRPSLGRLQLSALELVAWVALAGVVCCRTPPKQITSTQAKDHIGEIATVCGTVVSATFAENTRRGPTFLNLDEPYPKQIFTVVIWGADRAAFGEPEKTYYGKRICVTGLIENYRRKPEIVATNPNQIRAD